MVAAVSCVARGRGVGLLDEAVRELQRADRLAPVTVVVPSARSAIQLPRLLVERRMAKNGPGAHAGLVNVSFVTLARLADALGAPSLLASGRRRLTRTTLAAAVRNELSRSAAFGPSTGHPATASEVTERYEELRFAGALERRTRGQLSLGARANELLARCANVRAQLESITYDDVDLFEEAIVQMDVRRAPWLGGVVVYMPERARPAELAFLRSLAATGPLNALVALVGDHEADAQAEELGERLASTFGVSLTRSPISEITASSGPDRLLRAPDPRGEVRAAVRLLLERLALGSDPEHLALIYAVREPYLRLAVSELRSAGLVCSAPSPNPLASESPGKLLLALLELQLESVRRDALMRLLRSARILDRTGQPVPVAEWDRMSRLLGLIEGSIGEWIGRLHDLVRSGSHSDGDSRDATAARGLARFLDTLGTLLGSAERAAGWGELAAWARQSLETLIGPISDESKTSDDSLVAYFELLNELAALDAVEPGVTLSDLRTRLSEELHRPGPRIGVLGRGVIVGPLDQLVGIEVDLAVLLGANASNLPAGTLRSPLLDAAERQLLSLELLFLEQFAAPAQRRLGLIRRAAKEFVVTAPVVDNAGRQVVLSRLIDSAAATIALPGELGALRSVLEGGAARNAGEIETAAVFAALPAASVGAARELGLDELAGRLEIVASRERGEFGPYSGLLGAWVSEVASKPYSPTSLETIAVCPFRHFLNHVLYCEAIEEPEHRIGIDPRDRGNIVHEALEHYVRATIEDPSLGGADPELYLRSIANEVIARYERAGLTGKPVVFEVERRRILEALELERLVDAADRARTGVRPIAVEHSFGFGASPPVVVAAGERQLSFRGKIDRVDLAPDGSIVVIDYKTGRADSFAGIEDDPVDGGRHLQLPIYALAARAHLEAPAASVCAAFRFVGPVPSEISIVLDDAIEQRLAEALGVLTDSIVDGVFPMRPGEPVYGGPANCRYCDFDSVCPPDRARFELGACDSGRLDRYLSFTDSIGLATSDG